MARLLAVLSFVAFSTIGTSQAFDLGSFIDPLFNQGLSEMLTGGEEIDMVNVLDTAARSFLNISLGTTSTTTYSGALVIILAISAVLLVGLAILAALVSSAFTGLVSSEDPDLSRETVESAARLFVSLFNTTSTSSTTVSPSYALIIIVGISFILLIGLMMVYLAASSVTGAGLGLLGKRSLPDGDDGLDMNWTRIYQVLEALEEQFRRAGISDDEEECRKRTICSLAEENQSAKQSTTGAVDKQKMFKLASELSEMYETQQIFDEPQPQLRSTQVKAAGYHKAFKQGQKFGQCADKYQKCSK